MNKIYKVVWNTVRNCYVVGSELISSKSGRHSTSNGKSSSLKVTLTVLALCGMTALGSGVAPAYAADAGATTDMNQYVALKYDNSNNQNEKVEQTNGKRQTVTTFNGKRYIKVDSGVNDNTGRPIYYWVREGYSLTMVDGQPYTSLSSNGRRADVSWTGDANAKPSDILESVTSTHVQTNVTTNVGETLQQVNAGTYAGVSNSDGTEVNGKWNYIVKDSSWKGVVSNPNYRNGYADLISDGKPKGFVRTTDAGSKLAWNANLNAYTYNGKVVDYSNIYVIDGEIGVFTNASGSEVYTGTVFGKNNEVLMTVKKSDGKYYSYWGAEVNDAGATMDTYRVAEYQKDLNVLRDNDFALYHNDIKSVDMSTDASSATISLMRNGDGTTSPAVDGTLTLTNGGGTDGKDTYVRISNTTNGQEVSKTFSTGSKVSAIGSTDATTGLTINGVDYTIKPDVSWTAQAGGKDVNAVNQKVNFVGSDHITVTGTDGQIKFEATGLADTDLTNITNTAVTKIQNIAKGEDVHIKADTYTVGNDGSVTMTYVDGNGNTIDGTAKITGIAKSDLSNITNKGNTVIKNIAKNAVKVIGGTNTAVETSTTDNGPVEYKVNLNKDVNLGDTIQLNGSDGSISAKSGGARLSFNNNGLTVSQAKNGVTNETRINGAEITVDGGIGNQTTIKGSTARIGNVLVNGGSGTATITGLTNKTTDYTGFANGSGRAATEEQLKEVDSKAAAAKTTVTNGKNITVDEAKADDGSSTYTVGLATDVVLGDNAIKLNGSDGSISAKSGGAQLAFNNSGLTVSQAKNGLTNETRIDGATITVDGGTGNQTIINGSTARIGSVLVNGGSGTATITGLTNKTTDYTGFANGSGRAATEEQLKEVAGKAGEAIETAGKGWNLTTNGKEASKTNIAPDGTVDFSSSNDNLIISNAGANLSFSLSDNLDLTKNEANKGSVKVGKNTTLTDGLLQVGNLSLTANALTIDGSTYISASGINANKHKITNVLAGKDDMDAVNVGQLKSAIRDSQVSIKAGDGISVAKTGNQYTINVNIEGVTNNQGKVTVSTGDSTSTESGSESGSSGAKKFKVMDLMYRAESNEVAPETTTDTGKPMKIESIPEDIKLEADDNQAASVVNGETIKIAGDGTNISTKANVTGAGSMDTISVSLKPDIQVDSVTINNGGPTINNTGIDMNGKSITNVENITVNNGPTINSSGIDMNSQKIINLAEGDISETSTDAVNGGQLYNTNQAVIANAENINSLSHSLNKLDSRINRVGAGAAALAALHPLDFDPDNKWDFAAGYGNYAGANAVAIGTYYRPNENTMFSIGGSFGGGENMINAGVSFKLGSGGSGITTSKTVMAKKIKEQDELLKAQDAKMKEQDEKIAKLEALVAQQGEMIQQALGKK